MKAVIIKRIFKSVVFLLIFALILSILSYIVYPRDNTDSSGYLDSSAMGVLSEAEDTVDVIFLGSSVYYTAFNPAQLFNEWGISSYNVGTAGQDIMYSYELLQTTFERQHPKVVILDAYCITDKMKNSSALSYWVEEHFPVFRYHGRWKQVKWSELSQEMQYIYHIPNKGYNADNEVEPADTTNYMAPSDDVAKIGGINKYFLKKIKEFCDNNGATLLVVSAPNTVNWDSKKHNAVEQLAEEYDFTFVDMNTEIDQIGIDWSTDTRDGGDHLNDSGAMKVTHYIGQYLTDMGILTDHRGDSAYDSWVRN